MTSHLTESPDSPEPLDQNASADAAVTGRDDARARSYQELLRAMGAILDEQTTGSIGIVEVEDGFVVRAKRSSQTITEITVGHFDRAALRKDAEELRRTRRPPWRRHHPGIWSNFPVTHQDFFRALGYELDSIGARQVVIDEISDGLIIWYESAQTDGAPPVTRRIALGPAEIEEILNEAVRRRHVSGDARPSDVYQAAPPSDEERDAGDSRLTRWTLARRGVPYQELLRGIGTTLDRAGARNVCLVELPGAFAVRYDLPAEDRRVWLQFRDDEVPVEGPARRNKPSRLLRRGLALSSQPQGYSDILRALGQELEHADASDIVIVEQEDGLAVIYEYREPQQPLAAHRTMRFLGDQEQQAMIQHARSRRSSARSRGRFARF